MTEGRIAGWFGRKRIIQHRRSRRLRRLHHQCRELVALRWKISGDQRLPQLMARQIVAQQGPERLIKSGERNAFPKLSDAWWAGRVALLIQRLLSGLWNEVPKLVAAK